MACLWSFPRVTKPETPIGKPAFPLTLRAREEDEGVESSSEEGHLLAHSSTKHAGSSMATLRASGCVPGAPRVEHKCNCICTVGSKCYQMIIFTLALQRVFISGWREISRKQSGLLWRFLIGLGQWRFLIYFCDF